MKKLFPLFALLLALGGCKEVPEPEAPTPTIALEKGDCTATSLTFEVTHTAATEAAYMVLGENDAVPTLDEILAGGEALDVEKNDVKYTVTVEGLSPNTDYRVVAAAKSSIEGGASKQAGSNTLYVTTLELGEVTLSVELVQKDHEKINFRVKSANASRIAYLVMLASGSDKDADFVLLNGTEITTDLKEAVEVAGLDCSTEYKLFVAAEGEGQKVLAEPVLFKTDDDPANVISHTYTRARGSKWGSNYYVMLSYEDANEADNFAYNEKTLCLDFYGDAAKDYLPAGEYEVKESTEAPCLSSFRYSTYGYENGVKLKSGMAKVGIDPDTKAYTFALDLYLIDGRHLVATYEGDVDSMPVVDIQTFAPTFALASGKSTDAGETWTLDFEAEDGTKAHFALTNSFRIGYLVANQYTISTSEDFSGEEARATFDAESSYFTLPDGTVKKYATGTLTVDIDWEGQRYLISFNGTLEDNNKVEAAFDGKVDGISLEQSTEILDVVMNKATATSYGNTNYYVSFSQMVDGVEAYRLVLDTYCPASTYLPSGVYKLGVGTGTTYLGADATKLYVAGEGNYDPVSASATVTVNAAAKTYLFDVTFKVADGRTFKVGYSGAVEGMEIVSDDEDTSNISWTSVTAKHWYSDNWELRITDSEKKYKLTFDMRTGDSSLNYIPSGVYTLGTSGAYVDSYYSTFNGNKSAYSEVTLNIEYLESSATYNISFEAVHTDGRTFKGTYSGAVEGSPTA